MQRDLLDALRCPARHDESWLVAMVHVAVGSDLIHADVSCPVCSAEYPIIDGIAYFAPRHQSAGEEESPQAGTPSAAEGMRLAALLAVIAGGVPVALVGQRALLGPAMAGLVPVPQLHINSPILNATMGATGGEAPATSVLQVAERLPLGVGTVAAIAIDAPHATPVFLESAVRALRAGGRMVAPVATPIPTTLRELARDDRDWVAEAVGQASGLVELRRRDPDLVR